MKYVIITSPDCSWCERAKGLLDAAGAAYVEVPADEGVRAFLLAQDLKTVPQVFLGGRHIGGYDDLSKHLAWMEETGHGTHQN